MESSTEDNRINIERVECEDFEAYILRDFNRMLEILNLDEVSSLKEAEECYGNTDEIEFTAIHKASNVPGGLEASCQVWEECDLDRWCVAWLVVPDAA